MIVHLIDGTYELFRHFYGLRRFNKGEDPPFGAVRRRAAHRAADDRGAAPRTSASRPITSSSRSATSSGPGYKTGDGIEPALWAQFHPLEEALAAMGVAVWPMVELEADDALASAAHLAAADPRVEKVCIWTPDKDLAQCVRRRSRRAGRPQEQGRSATPPACGRSSASTPELHSRLPRARRRRRRRLSRHRRHRRDDRRAPREHATARSRISRTTCSANSRELALLFKNLATLRTDAPLFADVDEIRWRGPTPAFEAFATRVGDAKVLERARKAPVT